MTRIGLVVHGQPPEQVGGTEGLVAGQARALAAAGHEVVVFSGSIVWKPAQELVEETTPEGIAVTRVQRDDLFFERWDKLANPRVERAYVEWLERTRPELVHVHHWARLSTNLVRLARARGIPAVLSLHDLFASCPRYHRVKDDLSFCEDAPGPDVCANCAPRWSFQPDAEIHAALAAFVEGMAAEVCAADALLAPTQGHARRVGAWLGAERSVDVLPPAGRALPGPAARPLAGEVASVARPLQVGTFGHQHELKGTGVLLDALGSLPRPSRVAVHVWGAAPDEATETALRERARDLPVSFHGAYAPDDLVGAPLDAVVLPSLCAESYSFALDEAASLGVPVAASDLGALADRATERVARFPRGDAEALAALLLQWADEPAERERRVAAPAPATWSARAEGEALLAVYERVLAGPTPAREPLDAAQLAQRELLFTQREAGLQELLRSEGWEAVIAGLQAELAAARGGAGGGAPG